MNTLDLAPLIDGTSLKNRSGMARIVEDFTVLTAQPATRFSTGGSVVRWPSG